MKICLDGFIALKKDSCKKPYKYLLCLTLLFHELLDHPFDLIVSTN